MPENIVNYINFKISVLKVIEWFKLKHPKNKITREAQEYIHLIEDCLNTAKTGGDLWDLINVEIEKMPGKWSFFSTRRTLTLALDNLLLYFSKDLLLQADKKQLQKENDLLVADYSELEKKYFSLRKEFSQLKGSDLVEINKALDIRNKSLKEKIAALEISKDNHIKTIEILEKEVSELKQVNQQLASYNEKLNKMYENLSKRYEDFQITVSLQIEDFRRSQAMQATQIEQQMHELAELRKQLQQRPGHTGGDPRYFKSLP